jgi:signal transduction histidine kinase/integral membrane sensor domain MASE1
MDARGRSVFLTAMTALAVCVGYYAGANLGFILKVPPSNPSVLWAPNAILTATLLLTPPRRWWIYLLAALPAHLAAELGTVWPVSLVLMLFLTNCSEALIAALFVHRFSDAPARFDTLRRVAIFLVGAVFLAPFLSSFADAAVVTALRGEPYWLVWRTRFFANVLTELTLVPALVTVVTVGLAWCRRAGLRRQLEAAGLGIGLLVTAFIVFAGPISSLGSIPGWPGTPLAFVLPFILVAAVRFGSGGAGLSLLATALVAIWAATHGRGPFPMPLLAEHVVALQVFLSAAAIPLMCLAALIEERQQAQEALAERLRFEELLSQLSAAFVRLPDQELDRAIGDWLQNLGEFLHLDRLLVLRLSEDQRALMLSHSWTAAGVKAISSTEASQGFPWAVQRILRDEPFVFSRPDELRPPPAARNGAAHRLETDSDLLVPLMAGGRILGGLVFDPIVPPRAWREELVPRLGLVAEVFANALASKEAGHALRASEVMSSAILASLTSSVAVLDRDGRIVAVNESWTRSAHENGTTAHDGAIVGASYPEIWRRAVLAGAPHAAEARAGIEAVLHGDRPGFTMEYPCLTMATDRWYAMSVLPLKRPEGGVVVSRTDITERKRAELDAQRSRQELAHVTRVSTMGELTASLAHELNQPLTGILTNAQAARRFLEFTPPDLGEVRAILADIIDDDKRASEVIQRLRDLLRKGDMELRLLDIHALIRDVVKLVSSDLVIRNVTVTLDFAPERPVVSGNRVQLQQVVLNLLLNGMEAMADGARRERPLVVRTARTAARTVRVSVEDAGTGLREGTQDLVFEPFYTTKPTGMGMGLSIARSIIEAHNGVIWVQNNPALGATVSFDLPLADENGT